MRARVVYGKPICYFLEDREVSKEEFDTVIRCKAGEMIADQAPPMTSGNGWPLISAGAGVDPSQIAEAQAVNRNRGDDVEYVREGERAGDAIFLDRGQRKRHLKNIGLHDKDGAYLD